MITTFCFFLVIGHGEEHNQWSAFVYHNMNGSGDGEVKSTQLSGELQSELHSTGTLLSLPASRNSNYVVRNDSLSLLLQSADEPKSNTVKNGLIKYTSVNTTYTPDDNLRYENEPAKKTPLKYVSSPFRAKNPSESRNLQCGRNHDTATLIVKNHKADHIEQSSVTKVDHLDEENKAFRKSVFSPLHDKKNGNITSSIAPTAPKIVKDEESTIKKIRIDDEEQGQTIKKIPNVIMGLAAPYRQFRSNENKSKLSTSKEKISSCSSEFVFRGLCKILSAHKIPILLVVVIYFLFITFGAAFLLKKSFAIPGLRFQVSRLSENVDELEVQVDRFHDQVDNLEANIQNLTGQVDRLETENDRFALQNDILTANNAEYALQNSQLEARNQEYKALNVALNISLENYRFLNLQLHQENEHYKNLNDQLNQTVLLFSSEVSSLQDVRDNLTSSVWSFQNLTSTLHLEVGSISQKNIVLNHTIAALQDIKESLEINNEYYRQLNANLSTVVSFLNATSNFIGGTFDSIVSYLSSTIIVNRNLVLNQLYLTMRQIVNNWRCGITDTFLEPWVDDTSTPIGIDSYLDVLNFINTTVFSQLCISLSDFELFLGNRYAFLKSPSDISLSQLSSGLNVYTTATLKHYFPGEGQKGLTAVSWDQANFKCTNLPSSLRFYLFHQP